MRVAGIVSSDSAIGRELGLVPYHRRFLEGVCCTHGIFLAVCIDLVESIHCRGAHNIFPSYCSRLAIFDLEV